MSGANHGPGSFQKGSGPLLHQKARYPMRAEMEAIVDEIKQAISLLRRHL